MDVLSDVLKAIRLEGAVFLNAEFTSPWSVSAPPASVMAQLLSPGAGRIIIYHLLLEGECQAEVKDKQRVTLHAGEILILPHGDPHKVWHGTRPNPIDAELSELLAKGPEFARLGGGGESARFVCGYMACEPHFCEVVLAGLPPLVRVNIRGDASGQWLENSLRFSVGTATTRQPGSWAVLAKLSEALFTETLRRYIAGLPEEQKGWMAGARHPQVGKALSLLHREPERAWTIADLARQVGVSRSVLAERFTYYLGDPPMTYLSRWRLHLGAQKLASSSASVAEIAAAVGYESEAVFNRAFKRAFGEPPARFRGQWRKEAGAAP
jgi:AraC-like DNA-binding protein